MIKSVMTIAFPLCGDSLIASVEDSQACWGFDQHEVLNWKRIILFVVFLLGDVVPEMVFYSIEKGLAACCLNS